MVLMQNATPDTNLMTAAEYKAHINRDWHTPTWSEQRELRDRELGQEQHGGIPLTRRQEATLAALSVVAHQMDGEATHEPPAHAKDYLPGPYYCTLIPAHLDGVVEFRAGKATFKVCVRRDGSTYAVAER